MGSNHEVKDGLAIAAAHIKGLLDARQAEPVRVGMLGLGGAGKSSLVNAIVGKHVMDVNVRTDTTVEAQENEHNGVIYTDLPGFGTELYPEDGFEKRKFPVMGKPGRLVGIDDFDVLLCVHNAGGRVYGGQGQLFRRAMGRSKAALLVASKRDTVKQPPQTIEELEPLIVADVRDKLGSPKLPVHFVSTIPPYGLGNLQHQIWSVLGVAKQERWANGVKAHSTEFLVKKRAAAENSILKCSGLAAANGFNPIPGVSEAIDLGTMLLVFKEIRDAYGLSPARLQWLESHAGPVAARLASRIVVYAGPLAADAIIALLKRIAGRVAARELTRFIPIIGQAVAASIGFGITYWAGHAYLTECEELARCVLNENLEMPAVEEAPESAGAPKLPSFNVTDHGDIIDAEVA